MAQQSELLQIHVGNEATWGTAPTASGDWKKMPAITDFSISPMVEMADFPTLEGLAPIYNAAVVKDGGEASLSGIVNYEDLPLWLDSLLGEDVTPTTVTGTPTAYKYVYTGPHATAVASPTTFSLYYGTGSAGYELNGAMVNTLELTGSSGEALQLSVGFVGKQVVAQGSPQSPSDRSVNLAVASDVSLYIEDGLGSTFGTTQWTCTAYSFSLSVNANRSLIYALGSVAPCDTYHQRFDGQLDLSLEFPGGSNKTKSLLESLLSGPTLQQQCIRLSVSSDSDHVIQIDFAGTMMDSPDIFTDSDGVSTIDMSWRGTYDSTNTMWLDIEVTNLISDIWT